MIIKIDSVLKERKKTRNWLSEETGITYTNICNLCNGKTTSIQFDKIEKICSVLDCSIEDLLQPEHIDINRQIVFENKLNKIVSKGDTIQ